MPPFRSFEDRSIERFVEEMDEAGIDVAVTMGRNSPAPWGSVLNSDDASSYMTGASLMVDGGANVG